MKIILLMLTSITASYCQIFSVDSVTNLTGTTRLTTGSTIRCYLEEIQQINYGILINSPSIYKYDSLDWIMYTRSVITLDAFNYIAKHFNCDSTKMKCIEVKVSNRKYKFKDFRRIVWPESYIPTKE